MLVIKEYSLFIYLFMTFIYVYTYDPYMYIFICDPYIFIKVIISRFIYI